MSAKRMYIDIHKQAQMKLGTQYFGKINKHGGVTVSTGVWKPDKRAVVA